MPEIDIPPTWAVNATFSFSDGFSKTVEAEVCASNALEAFEADDVDGLDLADLDSLKDKYSLDDITSLTLSVERVG